MHPIHYDLMPTIISIIVVAGLMGLASYSILHVEEYPSDTTRGKAVYERHCQKCHGVGGWGDGLDLDFRTLSWTILPLPWSSSFDPKTYRAVYGARARLVRLVDKTVVWQGTCEYDKDSSLTPTLDLTHIDGIDKGIVVRNAFNTLAVHCADFLWRQFFGRDAGPDLPSPSSLEKQALR